MLSTVGVYAMMLELDTFTAQELAERSGVKQPTVHSVLSRQGQYIEEVGRDSTGKRGGQPRRYRLTERGRKYFGELLGSPGRGAKIDSNDAAYAALDVLFQDPPEEIEERRRIVRIADGYIGLADDPPLEICNAARLLLRVAKRDAEYVSEDAQIPSTSEVVQVAKDLLAAGHSTEAAHTLIRFLRKGAPSAGVTVHAQPRKTRAGVSSRQNQSEYWAHSVSRSKSAFLERLANTFKISNETEFAKPSLSTCERDKARHLIGTLVEKDYVLKVLLDKSPVPSLETFINAGNSQSRVISNMNQGQSTPADSLKSSMHNGGIRAIEA